MIIFGTRGVTSTKEVGEFACPGCAGSSQRYARRSVRRFFTLYFIPVIPLDKISEYIECLRCGGTYREEILDYNPAIQLEKARAEFVEYVKRVMILAALVDGQVDDAEVNVIGEIYGQVSGTKLPESEIRRELNLARLSKGGMAQYSRRFPGDLNEQGKELVIKATGAPLSSHHYLSYLQSKYGDLYGI